MELNRRNFIKMLVGGVAGIQATPLPWKLTDDIAIWTQNWPWVPVPPEGEFRHEKSVCTLCQGGCGIQIRKVDERAVKIEGRTDYPVNPGGVCPLCMGGIQLLYHENIRFKGPMKRIGPRGEGRYQQITWEEAIQELASTISDLRKNGRPEALAAVDGNPGNSTMSLLVRRFLKAAGSPNYLTLPNMEAVYAQANRLMTGIETPMAYDLENSDFVLSFGCGLIEGWAAPGRMFNAWGLWHEEDRKGKVKIVQIESRASNTASKSDQWLAPAPGTETALALGLAHVIIKEGLYDRDFVENHTFGFDVWASDEGRSRMGFKTLVLQKYPPEAVARLTGVDAGAVVKLAREFAGAKAPVALCGKGKGESGGSLLEFMAIQSLNALVGNFNKTGGVIFHEPLSLAQWPDVQIDGTTAAGLDRGRLDKAGSAAYPFSESLIHDFSKAVTEQRPSPIDVLLVFAANPAYTLPDPGSFRQALKKIPFIVSFSPYKDETAAWADLVLPDHTAFEKTADIVWPTGLQYPLYGVSKPLVKPVYDTRHSGDVLIKTAKKIGGPVGASFPWKSFEESLQERVKGLAASGGLTAYKESAPAWRTFAQDREISADYSSANDLLKKLRSGGLWYRPARSFRENELVFRTPSGRFEFFSTEMERAVKTLAGEGSQEKALRTLGLTVQGDEAYLPHFEPAVYAYGKEELLLMPYGLVNLSTGWLPTPPYLYKTLFDDQVRKSDSFAEINPDTAAKYDLKEGDAVLVKSPEGEVRARIHLFEGAMPGVVFLPMGLGHTAYDDFAKGKGANPNDIIQVRKDPLSGQPIWWTTNVTITKA